MTPDNPTAPVENIESSGTPDATRSDVAGTTEWNNDSDSVTDLEFAAIWLQRQCAAIVGARCGTILLAGMHGLVPAANWPALQAPPAELLRVADRATTAIRPIVAWKRRQNNPSRLDLLIGLGIRLHGSLAAVIAVAIDVPDGIESVKPDALAAQLHMGCGWLDARLSRRLLRTGAAQTARASVAMDVVAVASAQRRASQAAAAVINELVTTFQCNRVSIGLTHRHGIKLKAISHAAAFQQRSRVVDAIENAMEECLAQLAPIAHPPPLAMTTRISIAHRDLAAVHGMSAACASVVLPGPDGPAGVLTFERDGNFPFDPATLELAETVAALLGPLLRLRVVNDRLLSGRVVETIEDGIKTLLGPNKPSWKLAFLAGMAMVAVLCVATGDYRVTARAVLEGEVQRAAVAPFDGFVSASPVRPGDRVLAGDLLATMDDRDLVLERARAWADAEKLRQKYSDAMAKHDRPNTAMIAAQIDQADAELALAEDKLQRSRVVAPIDGLVVSGDLSQLIGSPLERGKTLFEIAPLDRYRVVLRTDERDLRYVAAGQSGAVLLAGAPGDRRRFTVSRITPIAESKDGRNEFRVEATLVDAPGPGLRPGMEGVAKVTTGTHRLVWIWTHGMVEWLRQTAWKWLP